MTGFTYRGVVMILACISSAWKYRIEVRYEVFIVIIMYN